MVLYVRVAGQAIDVASRLNRDHWFVGVIFSW